MGVRHLFTFISRSVPNGFFEVNLFDEVEKYKRNNPEKTPIIIIDLLALHQKLYTNDHEKLLGGRYNLYNDRARHMFSRFNELGAKIIYFLDGPVQSFKIKTNLGRREENYYDSVNLLRAIDNGLDLSQKIKSNKVRNLTSVFPNFTSIAKSMAELRKSLLNECDQEMVHLANQEQALAIMSDDSDFLIFEGNWKLWSTNEINLETMTTKEFNKAALRSTLSLSSQQMILLGTLSGNDILAYDMVANYHNRIAPRGGKFYNIARDIRHNMPSWPPKLNFHDEKYITSNVFQRYSETLGLRNLQKSLNWYNCNGMQKEFKNLILEQIATNGSNFQYDILADQERIIGLVYLDLSTNHFMPYYDLIRSQNRRTMGVLLYHDKNIEQIRRFYCKLKHDTPFELINETPEYPPIEKMPPLLEFLYHPYGKDEELDQLRLKMFCWIISSKINPEMIRQIPKKNLITVVTIIFLLKRNQITVEEGDCILLASNCDQELRDSLDMNQMKYVNGRDSRLSFLYPEIFNIIKSALKLCNLGTFCDLLNFDGLYFHILRKKCRENDTQYIKEQIEQKYQNLRKYYENISSY